MTNYNWSNLSGYDFEMLCRDLLAAQTGLHVEAFSAGRDGGIDLRAISGGQLIIGQAKHYPKSPFSKLLKACESEAAKMAKAEVTPNQYILFTTQGLTPTKKDRILEVLKPYCRSVSDIYGVDDIEGQLASNPSIERFHFKLWLSGARVINDIMGNALQGRSYIRFEEVIAKARLFVPPACMPRAEEILSKEKSLIISGAPGIGKTTLAEMLSVRFAHVGFAVHLPDSVDEIEARLKEDAKELYVFDDFLGRTSFSEAPPASQQERLFGIIRHFRAQKNKHLILTTREYLYNEAVVNSERFLLNRADVMKCLLGVTDYSMIDRARILYNHLYWMKEIPSPALEQFVQGKGYLPIVKHPEFNPRFIADALNRLVMDQVRV